MTRQLHAAARHDFPFWIAMADLDRFKSVNDGYGHDAGDTVLKKFAEILKSNTRNCDMCARIGGEELVWILTHAEKASVLIAIDRIRDDLASQEFTFRSVSLHVTASFGIAGFRGGAPDFPAPVKPADVALYEAKRNRRNRIEFAALEECVSYSFQ